jgi:alanine dehydrogenase
MPGAYARTATQALTNATMPYALKLANLGVERALELMPDLRRGLNTYCGSVVYPAVAEANGLPCAQPFGK